MKSQIEIREECWQGTMKALDEILEKVAQDLAKREELPIEEARNIAVRSLAIAIERMKMRNPITRK